jgi:hypothetical protein
VPGHTHLHEIGQIVKKKYLEGFRSKGGNKMYKSSVERILKNPEY